MSKISKSIILLIVVLMLTFSLAACSTEEVVAKVDGVKISQEKFYDRLLLVSGNEVLETLIAEVLVELESEKLDIEVSDEEIDEEIDNLTNMYGGEEGLKTALANSNSSMDILKDQILNNLRVQKLVEPYIDISDEDVEEYFEANKELLAVSEQVRARHILLETEEEADEIYEKAMAGEDFSKLAREFSTDGGSSLDGGDLGRFGRGRMVAEFDEAVFSMEVDEISKPVKSEFGFHIIKLDEKTEARESTLEEFEEDIRDVLSSQQMQSAYTEWFQDVSLEYDIVNYLPLHDN